MTGQGPGQQGSPQKRTRGWEGSLWPQLLRAPRPYSSSAWGKSTKKSRSWSGGGSSALPAGASRAPPRAHPLWPGPAPPVRSKVLVLFKQPLKGGSPGTFSPQPSSPQRLIIVQNPNPLILPTALPLTPPPIPAPRRAANQISPGTGTDQALSHSAAKGPQGKDACSPFTDGKTCVHRRGPPRPQQVSGGTGRQSQACTAPNAAPHASTKMGKLAPGP